MARTKKGKAEMTTIKIMSKKY